MEYFAEYKICSFCFVSWFSELLHHVVMCYTDFSEGYATSIFTTLYHEDGGSIAFRNVGILTHHYWCRNSEDHDMNLHCENLKSRHFCFIYCYVFLFRRSSCTSHYLTSGGMKERVAHGPKMVIVKASNSGMI